MSWQALGRFVVLGLLFLMSVGCASTGSPASAICPASSQTADGRPTVTLYFATNRAAAPQDGAQPGFGFGRSDSLSYGRLVVSLPKDEERGSADLGPGFGISKVEILNGGDRDFSLALRKAAAGRRAAGAAPDAFVFVHGYNESFERVALRTAQIVHDGCFDVVPVMFSWPSRHGILDYGYDHDSAIFSRGALADVLRLVRDAGGFDHTHLMAHSMGNWITLEALQRLGGPPSRRFGAVILASPDVDVDNVRRLLPGAMAAAASVTLLPSHNDSLLAVSTFLAHGAPRAGSATAQELADHGIESHGNFSIHRIDGPEIGECVGGSHRCAETHPAVLSFIRARMRAADGWRGELAARLR